MRILIIGASRGLGLGLATEFAGHGCRVVATVRTSGRIVPELTALDIETFQLELDNADDGARLQSTFETGGFDVLVLNAGIYGPAHQSSEEASTHEIGNLFMTNAVSPVRLARQILPLVRRGGVIAFMSSRTASITLNDTGDMELYRASKAALNSLARSFAIRDALPAGKGVLMLHPGWVQTEMGGSSAPVTIHESAAGLRKMIISAIDRPDFQFRDYLGSSLAW